VWEGDASRRSRSGRVPGMCVRCSSVGGNPDFSPLAIKAAYVMGVVHDLCESVSHLLKHENAKCTTYIPAYGVFASAIELLGRCIRGDAGVGKVTRNLKASFKWLMSSDTGQTGGATTVITTGMGQYTIDELVHLRHFAAHGQATGIGIRQVDPEILAHIAPRLSAGLDRYWEELKESEELCNKLGAANIIRFRDWPVSSSWGLFERDENGQHPLDC
jgi:hypothetical protein